MRNNLKTDCRFFVGTKPCAKSASCLGCSLYQPVQNRILVIKLGALGDLVRTICLLRPLTKAYSNAEITWVTTESCAEFLKEIPEIHRILTIDGPPSRGGSHLSTILSSQNWDLILNFDKDAPAPHLATTLPAVRKRGFGINEYGKLIALNKASEFALELGVNDNLKFRGNTKTYQEICLEMAELPFGNAPEPYRIHYTLQELQWALHQRNRWKQEIQPYLNPAKKNVIQFIGVNVGAADTFATKRWGTDRFFELSQKISDSQLGIPVLLGGPKESAAIDELSQKLRSKNSLFVRPGEKNTLRQFGSLFFSLDAVVSGDTLALHLALAAKRPLIALFTSTSAIEIEGYDFTKKIIGSAPCAPCYKQICPLPRQVCAENITVERVFSSLVSLLHAKSSEKEASPDPNRREEAA